MNENTIDARVQQNGDRRERQRIPQNINTGSGCPPSRTNNRPVARSTCKKKWNLIKKTCAKFGVPYQRELFSFKLNGGSGREFFFTYNPFGMDCPGVFPMQNKFRSVESLVAYAKDGNPLLSRRRPQKRNRRDSVRPSVRFNDNAVNNENENEVEEGEDESDENDDDDREVGARGTGTSNDDDNEGDEDNEAHGDPVLPNNDDREVGVRGADTSNDDNDDNEGDEDNDNNEAHGDPVPPNDDAREADERGARASNVAHDVGIRPNVESNTCEHDRYRVLEDRVLKLENTLNILITLYFQNRPSS